MRVEGGLAEWELAAGAGLTEKANKSSSKKIKRRQKKPPAMPSLVQKLFDTCRDVFADARAGVIPSTVDVERLRSVLDHMTPADVGLSQNMRYFGKHGNAGKPPVTYLHLYACDKFSVMPLFLTHGRFNPSLYSSRDPLTDCLHEYLQIGIFCLPQSAVIPLHNHPGMTVFSKILFGSLHIKSYDWADSPQQANRPNSLQGELLAASRQRSWGGVGVEWSGVVLSPITFLHIIFSSTAAVQHPGRRLAKVKTDSTFTAPCSASILYPAAGGNMHCFTAVTPCAVLDVLGPPYSDDEGRDCTYYNDFSYGAFSDKPVVSAPGDAESYAWLEEREKPEDFIVVGAKYGGPRIVDNL
ncbi:hypothetical protein Taro_027381 [Colocasia esculenta]|uniref:cysteine dioxygenase n=1 Tax=Colocasia esculenta TaxID=4460 RepID=A0A843VNJ8_COLES|nr:hypothetical protein [Colocasia esculenta]